VFACATMLISRLCTQLCFLWRVGTSDGHGTWVPIGMRSQCTSGSTQAVIRAVPLPCAALALVGIQLSVEEGPTPGPLEIPRTLSHLVAGHAVFLRMAIWQEMFFGLRLRGDRDKPSATGTVPGGWSCLASTSSCGAHRRYFALSWVPRRADAHA